MLAVNMYSSSYYYSSSSVSRRYGGSISIYNNIYEQLIWFNFLIN
jgi:hypothetical protein